MKDTASFVWYEFVHYKSGDDYLCLYLSMQKSWRKAFKITTIIFSVSGIFTAFNQLRDVTIFFLASTGAIQILTSLETFIIHSEDAIEKLSALRILYYNHANKLEELYRRLYNGDISEKEAEDAMFELRKEAIKIEEADNNLHIRQYKFLRKRADLKTLNYLNKIYNV